jgi:hypothetical protein
VTPQQASRSADRRDSGGEDALAVKACKQLSLTRKRKSVTQQNQRFGRVAEWFKAPVLKI